MQLTPRYATDPVITLDGPPAAIAGPLTRQRQRLADVLGSFTQEQWDHPSRCEGWSAQDVLIHLDSTNVFWTFSITAGLRGEPTRFLATFDPVTSPAQLVADAPRATGTEVLDRFRTSTDALAALVRSLDDDQWRTLAEAPPGHITTSALAHHALWDSWVHERDILVPLGIDPTTNAEEIIASLRYAAALGPALARNRGDQSRGTLTVSATNPDVAFVVAIGDHVSVSEATSDTASTDPARGIGERGDELHLHGDAVDVLEALSIRRPLPCPVPPPARWMLQGLAETFDVPDQP